MNEQGNTGSRTQNEKDKKELHARELEENAEVKALLANPNFLRFVLRLLDVAHPMQLSWNLQSKTQDKHEGERNIGNWVLTQIIRADREAFSLVMAEQLLKTERKDV